VRKGCGEWIGAGAHEVLQIDGDCHRFTSDILHEPYRNFREHCRAIDDYTRLQAEAMAAEGRRAPLWRMTISPAFHLIDTLLVRRGLLDGWRGLSLAGLGAVNVGLKWARLRRVQR